MTQPKKRVQIESPYGTRPDGTRCSPEEIDRNVRYARALMLYALRRGFAPFASHLLYTQCLADATPEERELGIEAGLAFLPGSAFSLVGLDLGVTSGMERGIKRAEALEIPVMRVKLGAGWDRAAKEAA